MARIIAAQCLGDTASVLIGLKGFRIKACQSWCIFRRDQDSNPGSKIAMARTAQVRILVSAEDAPTLTSFNLEALSDIRMYFTSLENSKWSKLVKVVALL